MLITMRDGSITAAQYRSLRKKIGTQEEVAALLGVHRVTIAEREAGRLPILAEAEYALCWIAAREAKFTRRARRSKLA